MTRKTAEEVLSQCCTGPEASAVWSHEEAIDAMREFAAQEVEAYKERLRAAIVYADDDGSSRYREGMNSVLDLIDTVK